MSFLAEVAERKRRRAGERFGPMEPAPAGAGRDTLPTVRPFLPSLLRGAGVIAELKRRSPSRGEIRPHLDVAGIARSYERGGASAISVVTETEYFGGSLDDLREAREATSLPVMRKDFLVHREELRESRRAGADAVLLIAAILTEEELTDLLSETHGLGMEALVEIHHVEELAKTLAAGASLIGINNRDLATLTVDLATSRLLLPRIPRDRVAVVESGIRRREDIDEFSLMGARGFLIGEVLLTAPDPEQKLQELTGGDNGQN